MKSKLAGIIVIMAVIGFLFVACSDGGGDALDGTTWKATEGGQTMILTFSSPNFTMTMNGTPAFAGTYSISGSSATLTFTNDGGQSVNLSGTLSGNTLTISGEGETHVLTKQ